METWGEASFENDAAREWFYGVEEAVDPGSVIAEALDDALAEAGHLDVDPASEAIAAAELSASCAGHAPQRLPDDVRRWVMAHPHHPHDSEIDQAVLAVTRIRGDSALRELWDEAAEGSDTPWLREVDDLIVRLARAGAGEPATLSP